MITAASSTPREDKRKAVKMLLENEKWKNLSSRQIAEKIGVDKNTVQKVRESLELVNSPTGSDQGSTVVGKDGKSYPAKKKAKPAKKGPNGQRRCQGN